MAFILYMLSICWVTMVFDWVWKKWEEEWLLDKNTLVKLFAILFMVLI